MNTPILIPDLTTLTPDLVTATSGIYATINRRLTGIDTRSDAYTKNDAAITLAVASGFVTDRLAEIGADPATVVLIRNKLQAVVDEIDGLTIGPAFRVVH